MTSLHIPSRIHPRLPRPQDTPRTPPPSAQPHPGRRARTLHGCVISGVHSRPRRSPQQGGQRDSVRCPPTSRFVQNPPKAHVTERSPYKGRQDASSDLSPACSSRCSRCGSPGCLHEAHSATGPLRWASSRLDTSPPPRQPTAPFLTALKSLLTRRLVNEARSDRCA